MFGVIDESGETGFKFTKGSSPYFILVLILTSRPESLCNALKELRKQRKLPENFEFSFHETTHKVRGAFLRKIKNLDFSIFALVVDKRILPQSFTKMSKSEFYVFFVSEFLLTCPVKRVAQDAILVLDEFDKSAKTIRALKKRLRKEIAQRKLAHQFKKIKPKRSRGEDLIQIADMIAGAIQRKYAKQESKYFKMISSKKIAKIWEFKHKKTRSAIPEAIGTGRNSSGSSLSG